MGPDISPRAKRGDVIRGSETGNGVVHLRTSRTQDPTRIIPLFRVLRTLLIPLLRTLLIPLISLLRTLLTGAHEPPSRSTQAALQESQISEDRCVGGGGVYEHRV